MNEAGRKDLNVTLTVQEDESSPESFQIRSVGPNQVRVTGSASLIRSQTTEPVVPARQDCRKRRGIRPVPNK